MTYKDSQILANEAAVYHADETNSLTKKIFDDCYARCVAIIDNAYATYLKNVPEDKAFDAIYKNGRLEKIQTAIHQEYVSASVQAEREINNASAISMYSSYYTTQYTLTAFEAKAGVNMQFSFLDPDLVEFAMSGEVSSWEEISASIRDRISVSDYQPQAGSLSDILLNNRSRELTKIQQTVVQGFLNGYGSGKTADMMRDCFDDSEFNADCVARTEIMRMSNTGDFAAYQDATDQGVEMQKQWMAFIDDRTRPDHELLNGVTIDVDDEFTAASTGETALYPGGFPDAGENINCRCTTIAVVKGLEDHFESAIDPVTGEDKNFDYDNLRQWMIDNGEDPDKTLSYITSKFNN